MDKGAPDVIVAFGFTKEGEGNRHLASYAAYLSKQFSVPIFTQKDVARCFANSDYHLERTGQSVLVAEEWDTYLSTLGIATALKREAGSRNWRRVAVVAAPCHEWRCIRDLRKMGFKVIKTDDYLRRAYWFHFWYNRKDPQLWVHGPLIWWLREIPLRLLPWNLYSRLT